MRKPVALVTGCTGMDGSHLMELLLEKGYEVHGLMRRHSNADPWRIRHLLDRVEIHTGDLLDQAGLANLLSQVQPHEVYNLAAQSFVKASFEIPVYTAEATGLGALKLFEAVRCTCHSTTRVFQASSSEMFGNVPAPQNEYSAMYPVSPYGVAKLFAHRIAQVYRQSYRMFIACGISFNHEGERRGSEFVTRKITLAATRIKAGLQDFLELGDTSARRDWSFAPDVMRGAWASLQRNTPDDYVFASGETHSVQEFINIAFNTLGLNPKNHVRSGHLKHQRPTEIWELRGDPSKARTELGWLPTINFTQLVQRMIAYDLSQAFYNSPRANQN